MGKWENKRNLIFKKYVENLNLLIDNNLISAIKDYYICPICLSKHRNTLEVNPLTLEDAPPKALGGKANILTCKSCNNSCGYKIDSHLTQRLKDLDLKKLLPNSIMPIEFTLNEKLIKGKLKIDKKGNQQVIASLKNNNPESLHSALLNAKGQKFEPFILYKRVEEKRLEYALLKTAYLLAFERFGYLMILDKSFDIVRRQIKNPDINIYPCNFYITPNLSESLCDVYYVQNKGIESLFAIFPLKTKYTTRIFAVFLPVPNSNINSIIKNYLLKSEDKTKEVIFNLYPIQTSERDFIGDIKHIQELKETVFLNSPH